MSNRLNMVQQEFLFLLFSQNWSDRKINKATGIHRTAISRYRKEYLKSIEQGLQKNPENPTPDTNIIASTHASQNVPLDAIQVPTEEVVRFQLPTDPEQDPEPVSKSKAFGYHDTIATKLKAGQNAKSIYQDLVTESQYSGGYDSVKRYVRLLKNTAPKLYARIETPPGEQAQVDFGDGAPTLKNGRYCKPNLFVMTLSNSRKSYQEVVWPQDVETFLTCHEHAFQFFGGVTKTVIMDNLKSAVLKAHLYEPEMNPNYLAFAQHYNFVPLPCKVQTPQHKGKVENNIGYVQDNGLTGKKFNSLEEQNQYLRNWDKTWASTRIHGTTKRQVNIMFEEEKPYLSALPQEPFVFFKFGPRKVSAVDSHIEVAGAYYPIPPKYMGQYVMVHYNSKWVKVFSQNSRELIQFLTTVPKGRFHPDRSCLPPHKYWSQDKLVQHLFQRCTEIGPSVVKWAELAEQQRQQRAYRSIQGVIALTKKYPAHTINRACLRSIESRALSYHVVSRFAEEIRIQQEIQHEIQFTQASDVIRSPLDYQHIFQEVNNG
ncbi:MAG: IS21 family transposase [Desulfobacterales bacterium]|nr:MAG: IS21 family transposase [Desulfobacterales bacterium]